MTTIHKAKASEQFTAELDGEEVNILITMRYRGLSVNKAWGRERRPNFDVEVTVEAKGNPVRFEYWESINTAEKIVKAGREYHANGIEVDPIGALECALSDATCYLNAGGGDDVERLDDFAEEFGYTKPSKARAAFNACRDVARDFRRLLGSDEKTFALAELVRERE